MRSGWMMLALATATPAVAQSYHVAGQLPAGDGGWDLLSVDPADAAALCRAWRRRDGDRPSHRQGDRPHRPRPARPCRACDPRHARCALDQRRDQQRDSVRRAHGQGPRDHPDRHQARRRSLRPATRTVWIMNPGSGDMTVVDPASAKVLATVPVGGSLELGVADGRGRLYVNIEDRNEVVVIDTRAPQAPDTLSACGLRGPTGIAYDPASREIVSACGDNAVAIVSAPDGRQIAALPIGKGADGAAFDARRRRRARAGGPRRQPHADPPRARSRRWSARSRPRSARGRSQSIRHRPRLSALGDACAGSRQASGQNRCPAASACWSSRLRS